MGSCVFLPTESGKLPARYRAPRDRPRSTFCVVMQIFWTSSCRKRIEKGVPDADEAFAMPSRHSAVTSLVRIWCRIYFTDSIHSLIFTGRYRSCRRRDGADFSRWFGSDGVIFSAQTSPALVCTDDYFSAAPGPRRHSADFPLATADGARADARVPSRTSNLNLGSTPAIFDTRIDPANGSRTIGQSLPFRLRG